MSISAMVGPEINTHSYIHLNHQQHSLSVGGLFCNRGWENETRSLSATLYNNQRKMMKDLHVRAETLKSIRQK